MDDNELLRDRFNTLQGALRLGGKMLKQSLEVSPAKRMGAPWSKPDGSKVTDVDIRINHRAMQYVRARHPEDDFEGEEMQAHLDFAAFRWGLDPCDNTNGVISYDPAERVEFPPFIAVMLSCRLWGSPEAFGLAYPLQRQTFSGCARLNKLYRNGKAYRVPDHKLSPLRGLLIGINDEEMRFAQTLKIHTGKVHVSISNLSAWLILSGHAAGGLNWFHLPWEAACILAAVKSAGGKVTDLNNRDYNLGNSPTHATWAVWSLPGHADHQEIIARARETLEKKNTEKRNK